MNLLSQFISQSQNLDLIETIELLANANSVDFIFDGIDFDSDSALLLIFEVGFTAGSGQVTLQVNTIASNSYSSQGRLLDGGVETFQDNAATAGIIVTLAALAAAANEPVFCFCYIGLNKSGTADRLHIISSAYGAVSNTNYQISGTNSGDLTSITQITLIETGVREFVTGSRFSLYRITR